jgi:CRISPR/Cas system-associated endonuclease Cas1
VQSLYIDRRDSALDVSGATLLLRHPAETRPMSFPLQNLERVIVSARVDLSTSVLQACSRAGVALVILNPRSADVVSVTLPWTHGHAAVSPR